MLARSLGAMFVCCFTYLPSAIAQRQPPAQAPAIASLPPATKMEAFQPAVGSVVTFGYDDLGLIPGVAVDAREISDSKGTTVRGLLVDVTESEYRKERSFVDADEIPELLKGVDSLLAVTTNPTSFKNFEVRYTTKGGLQLTAFNTSGGKILYAVQAGRYTTAQRVGLDAAEIRKLRDSFVAAQEKLSSTAATKH